LTLEKNSGWFKGMPLWARPKVDSPSWAHVRTMMGRPHVSMGCATRLSIHGRLLVW
jgi:hypothetical protein